MPKELTKKDIMRSTDDYEDLELEQFDGVLKVRPLNDAQVSEVEAKLGETMTMKGTVEEVRNQKGQVEINVSDLRRTQSEARRMAFMFGVKGNWKPEDIVHVDPDIIRQVSEHIMEISGIQTRPREEDEESLEEQVKNFRE